MSVKAFRRVQRAAARLVAAVLLACAAPALAAGPVRPAPGTVVSGPTAIAHVSVALRDLPVTLSLEPWPSEKAEDRVNPWAGEPDPGHGTWNRAWIPEDPLVARSRNPGRETPVPRFDFEGTDRAAACNCVPPDPVGDVGPNDYVQIVNLTKIAVFDKSGNQTGGPIDLSSFWSSGDCAFGGGDPVVEYDSLADRWVLSQLGPAEFCIAVSQSPDPLGNYFIYSFLLPNSPDYSKLGVWSDAYFLSSSDVDHPDSYDAWALERSKMLLGQPAQSVKAAAAPANLLLPADLDGRDAPPSGSSGLFYTFLDGATHGGSDRLELDAFHVDWTTPANSTWTLLANVPIASFSYSVCGAFIFDCAPQAGTTRKLDVVSEWPMQRFAYRRFGDHESLVGNFTVPTGMPTYAAPRWFELRRVGSGAWSLYQEGTYSPSSGVFRFMGSIAQDVDGDIALGYTASSGTIHPQIRYATRLASDPLGTLGSEVTMTSVLVNGSQTGSNRWGDYTAMAIDPSDGCTFWYTNEYYSVNSSGSWKTRVGSFRIPGCGTIFVDGFESGDSSRWSVSLP